MTSTKQKKTLVLLSGLLCDYFVWRDVAAQMQEVAAPQIFSFAGYDSIEKMAHKVLAEAPATFALAGHSMGGRVALEAYRQAPERVSALALLNTGVHPRRESEVAGRQRLLDLADSSGMAAVAEEWLIPMMSSKGRENKALVDELRAMILRHSVADFHGEIQALLDRPDASKMLHQITVDTLLLSGTEDNWSPVSQHAEMQTLIPSSQLVSLEGIGHMSIVEAPEEICAAFRAWLRA